MYIYLTHVCVTTCVRSGIKGFMKFVLYPLRRLSIRIKLCKTDFRLEQDSIYFWYTISFFFQKELSALWTAFHIIIVYKVNPQISNMQFHVDIDREVFRVCILCCMPVQGHYLPALHNRAHLNNRLWQQLLEEGLQYWW